MRGESACITVPEVSAGAGRGRSGPAVRRAGIFAAAGRELLLSLAALYIRIVGWTSRIRWYGAHNIPSGGFIYACWHHRLLYFVYSHRGQGITALVSKSKDGEYISSVIHRFGFNTIRGSSSRAARQSAIQMVRCLRQGNVCAITPDGPKGPAREVKDGIVYLAQKTGAPVVPISCSLSRKKFLPSWDSFMVPFPFSRAAIVAGKPIRVNEGDDPEEAAEKIRRSLDAVTRAADVMAVPFPGGKHDS